MSILIPTEYTLLISIFRCFRNLNVYFANTVMSLLLSSMSKIEMRFFVRAGDIEGGVAGDFQGWMATFKHICLDGHCWALCKVLLDCAAFIILTTAPGRLQLLSMLLLMIGND